MAAEVACFFQFFVKFLWQKDFRNNKNFESLKLTKRKCRWRTRENEQTNAVSK